jgi:phosphoribosylanthranilate isomerase/indole-3-glycerol phosphate synthase/phosphoribosylanthranilate isomerase
MSSDPAGKEKSFSPSRPWIKICGLTQPENALGCANLGADAVGMVFFEKSPRNISTKQAEHICAVLPDHVCRIGVFVDEPYITIMETVDHCGLNGVQLHGNEPSDLVDRLLTKNLVVIKAVFAAKSPVITRAAEYKRASFILMEYGKGILPGGNAESWNYELSLGLKIAAPVLLAGGLGPENIRQAMTLVRPAGFDVSSGVEKTHGIKDLKKVESFINQIRSCSTDPEFSMKEPV